MTPILYEKDEIDFTSQGLGSLVEIYDVDVEEQRNGLLQLTASYPVSGLRYADISVGRIILAKPNQRDDVHAFRIVNTELDISGYAVTVEADSITYDLTHNLVKHLVVSGNGQSFMTALKNAVVNPSIFAFYSDIATPSTTSLNYVNPMEAIMGTTGSFLQIWGGELKRENRRVAMFNRRGRDNVATFRLGKNISGLKYSVDISSLVTRIIPTKSVQNDDQTTTTLEGTPVDSQYINNYEQIYTLPLEFTDDAIKTVADLNTAAKGWFTQSANTGRDKPTVTIDIDVLSLQDSADYQDKFKNLESVSLTDTVTVYVPEYGVNVTAIVNELHYDPILDRVTKMTVGTAKQSFADSSRTQLSDLQDKIISVQNQADAVAVSANGKSTNYYGSVKPSHPQEGDTWFWVNGDKSGIKVFVNGEWVEPVDSDTQEKIAAGVTEAISQANAHTATAIEQNNISQQEVMNDIAKSQADLAIKDGDFNNKAQAMADEALANAKANTATVAQEKLDTANQNIANAKSDINATINALSVGGRNYFITNTATKGYLADNGVINGAANHDMTSDFISVSPNDTWIATGRYNSNASSSLEMVIVYQFYDINKAVIGARSRNSSGKYVTQYSVTKTIPSGVAYMRVSSGWINDGYGSFKIEKGTIPTDYTSAPEDVVLDYTTKDNQIKETITQYKDTNDGKVSKAQTEATTALGLVATKVSQTDYDKKTGDLTTAVNTAKSTADGAVTTIGNYQTSNDKRVAAAESKIEQNANDITARVAKTDYDNNNSQLNERFTKVEATADGASTTVGELSTKVNDLGQINIIPNSDFTPDLGGWWELSTGYGVPLPSDIIINGTRNGSSTIGNRSSTVNYHICSPLIGVVTGKSYSVKMNYDTAQGFTPFLTVVAMSSSGKPIGTVGNNGEILSVRGAAGYNQTVKYENLTIPSGVDYVSFVFWFQNSQYMTCVSQPMMVIGSTIGSYVSGNYNNNDKVARQQIRIDGITNIVSDPSTGLSTRVQTAEGMLNTVKSTADGAMSKASQTANDITREIENRKTGDTNTLQSSKDFTQSSITNAVSGVNSTISQTANGIIAQLSAINLFSNSEFSLDKDWREKTGTVAISGSSKGNMDGKAIGTVTVTTTASSWQGWKQNTIPVSGGVTYSFSTYVHYVPNGVTSGAAQLDIWWIDKSGNNISNSSVYTADTSNYWIRLLKENVVAPTGAVGVNVSLLLNAAGAGQTAIFAQPMVNVGTKSLTYTPNESTKTTLSLLKDNWSIGISDNIGNITSGIVGNSDSMSLISDNITLDGNTTVTGDFYAKGGNFKNLNASNLTVGTLNGSQVNITNINASNIVSGAISGANLNINLNTGSVVFQKGRINSSDYTTDINIDQGYISTANGDTRALLTQGKLQLVAPNIFSPQTTPYLEISNDSNGFNGFAGLIKARDSLTVSISGHDARNYNTPSGTETFVGMSIGNDATNELLPTKIGGANQGVVISGGNDFTLNGSTLRPFIYVGTNIYGSQSGGDSVYIRSSYLYSQSTYLRTTSSSANVVVNGDGALIRSSSARKYKLDIKNNIPIDDSLKLIDIPLSTWVDKHEHEENGSNKRYFGMIAEDLRDAGLEYLVQYGEDNEVEGINYDRVALLLIPLVKELKERIEELESEGK